MNRHFFLWVTGALGIALLLNGGCAPRTVTSNELQQYVADEDNGLRKRAEQNGFTVELSCRPTDLIIAQHYQREIQRSPNTVDSLKKALDQYIYFVLKLSRQGQEVEQSFLASGKYEQASQYLNYALGQQIRLVDPTSHQSVGVTDYLYSRMYGSTGQSTAIIAFEKAAIQDASNFVVELHNTQLGMGDYRFDFATKDLENIPALNFSI